MLVPRRLLFLLALGVLAERDVSAEENRPSANEESEVGLSPGQRFPNLRLPTLEGSELRSLRDYRGKKLLLHIFASW